ncbi:Sensor for unfolded proteins in the ER ire1 [Dirofilaria immitis]
MESRLFLLDLLSGGPADRSPTHSSITFSFVFFIIFSFTIFANFFILKIKRKCKGKKKSDQSRFVNLEMLNHRNGITGTSK